MANSNKSDHTLDKLDPRSCAESAEDASYLVRTCHCLGKKPIRETTTEDFRIMIDQNLGLLCLVPSTLEQLEQDPLVEAVRHPADLLPTVLSRQPGFWTKYPDLRCRVVALLTPSLDGQIVTGDYSMGEAIAAFRSAA